ncbi:TonB-dependent receptor plug domain-containing protein [Wenzhouxiangella limi]|uniref:TonB-dependent receptor n=1 Tax=Wenzhouxiangella limi TaxID=2707351 RepID=A0A845V3Z9_9GAMM|nr:TonB-dependent receptor [Wenzhouxiangella limi]NDY94951.1 TonB-dependent receptor [Wenzhouxiangella limi]
MLIDQNKQCRLALAIKTALVAGTFSLVSTVALAQSTDSAEEQAEAANTIDRIAVTGTRRRDRTVTDSSVPIDIISSEALEQTGLSETSAILARVLPSFNFPRPSITDGTDQIRPAQLRGLAPDQTLVLINGKRRHASALLNLNGSVGRGSSAVDLNLIPPNAIERIEVLRDGAAAQYGSDAIAGVINIVLKEGVERFNASAILGRHQTGLDGVPRPGPVAVGEDGSLVVSEGAKRTARDGKTVTARLGGGFEVGEEGYFNIAAQFRDRDSTNRSGFDPRQNYPLLEDGSYDPREFRFDRINHRYGDPEVKEISAFFNGAVPLGSMELYTFGNYASREGDAGGFYRRALDGRNVLEIYPDGFLPLITTDTDDSSLAAGVRGEIGEWFVDASIVYGTNELDFGVINSLNRSLGPTSQTEFEAGSLRNHHMVYNVDASKLFNIGDIPTNIAFGAEFRDEEYELGAGEPNSIVEGPFGGAAGSQVFPGFTPESEITGERDNTSLYAEVDADLTQRLNASAALRYEDYSDFGSTLNWKVAGRFQATDAFGLRGSVATGFRAPSLAQQSFTSIATVFVDGVPTETGTFRPDSDVARALGSPGLEEETSFSYSLGFVWQPMQRLNITADFFRIDIDDRIVLSENLSGPGIEELLAGTGANRARFFLNGIDSETKGVDIVSTYSLVLEERGTLDFNAGFNYTDNKVADVLPPPDELAEVGVTEDNLFSSREQRRFEIGSPKSSFNFGATWRYGNWRVTGLTTRFGRTVDPQSDPARDQKMTPKWVTDLEVGYRPSENWSIAVGANNLLDVYPDTREEMNDRAGVGTTTFNRIFPYSSFSPFGFNGRFVYSRVTFEF